MVACLKCARLLAEFARVAEVHYVAVKALASRIKYADAAEYINLKAAMDEARMGCELADRELKQHSQANGRKNHDRVCAVPRGDLFRIRLIVPGMYAPRST
jgi:hypothetical protein